MPANIIHIKAGLVLEDLEEVGMNLKVLNIIIICGSFVYLIEYFIIYITWICCTNSFIGEKHIRWT